VNSLKQKTILMIALDFPPCQSAGVQRTLKFAEYLAKLGWQPIVLTVNEEVYRSVDTQVTISHDIKVYRCQSLDSAKDLSIKGKYFAWSKVPDRWWSWAITAIPLGKKLVDKYQPNVIWSTYPVSTAHFIAYRLEQYSGLPWVADYRDPLQCRYDNNVQQYSFIAKWIEKKTIKHSTKTIFTTKQAAQLYYRLYPDEQLNKFCVIENGFDERNFEGMSDIDSSVVEKYTLLHSGAVYPNGRDPLLLFKAIGELKQQLILDKDNFELIFRGAPRDSYHSILVRLDIVDLVFFKPNIPYKQSLSEMLSSSGLLLIQGGLFNKQIPGKAYEYIRCNKAILALTPKYGATGQLLFQLDSTEVVENIQQIKKAILFMLQKNPINKRDSQFYSRYYKTQQLDVLLSSIS
jgi:hypothetical protein